MIAHINIGSNLGHRAELLSRAVTLLNPLVGNVIAISKPIESDPCGYDSPNKFLNVGVNVESGLSAEEIIERLREIELEIDPESRHRNSDGTYRDRLIDLDLICLDQAVSDTPRATLPHPRMHQRRFVLAPMAEILPDWRHPLLKLTPCEILKTL